MEHSQADKKPYAEARFGGFGQLSGLDEAPWRETTWGGPFCRIRAAQRATRSTRRTAKKTMSITAEKVTLTHPTPPNQSPTPAQCVCLQANMNVITLPHPTQPKPDPSSVRVFASETERYYPTPPHPTKARPQLRVCVCKRNWTLLPHPTQPNQSPTPAQCVCLQAKLNVIPLAPVVPPL